MNRLLIRHALLSMLPALLCACGSSDRLNELRQLQTCIASETEPRETVTACSAAIDAGGLDQSDRVLAHLNRGRAFGMLGNDNKALTDFNRALALDPDSAGAHFLRGNVLARGGEFDSAMQEFTRAAALDPKDVYAVINISSMFEQKGDMVNALKYNAQAIALAPDYSVTIGGRCWLLAVLNRDLDDAVGDCNHAMKLPPQGDPAFTGNLFNSRGFAYFRQGRYAEAIADYDRSIELAPDLASSYYIRGLAKRALGDPSAGEVDLAQSMLLDPNVAKRYAGFGVAP